MSTQLRAVLMCSLILIAFSSVEPAEIRAQSAQDLDAFSDQFESLVERVSPAIVQIFAKGYMAMQPQIAGGDNLLARQQATGSGVIVDPDGYIVTNNHVIAGATKVQVLLQPKNPGTSALKAYGELVGAQVIGYDEETDLAVLKVRRSDLAHLPLGDSDQLRPGELVFAFGSPLGLENSVTMGVVSATARQLRREDPMIYIQTDAPINPGNSGGPLISTKGEVVGINTLILSQSGGSEGLGFAAPSNIVNTIYQQLRNRGNVRRGVIGVHTQTITPALSTGLGLKSQYRVILGDVYPNGPADKAGLKPGDVIVTLNDKVMENGRQFDVNLYGKAPGDKVKLRIVRDGKEMSFDVEVIDRPNDPFRFREFAHPQDNLVPQLGILALTVDGRIQSMVPGLRYDSGVIVAMSSGRASAWGDGLVPGDVIYRVNSTRINSLEDLQNSLDGMREGDTFVAQVQRQGQMMYLALEVE